MKKSTVYSLCFRMCMGWEEANLLPKSKQFSHFYLSSHNKEERWGEGRGAV
jgi:hypothetical protein